jgi:hypothetical protein
VVTRQLIEADVKDVKEIAKRLRQMANGRELRKALVAALKSAAEPAASRARSRVRAIPHRSASKSKGGSLGGRVAAQVRVKAATGGKSAGVRVSVNKRSGLPRGFTNAPHRLNRPAGWRHPVYGRGVWVVQVGQPGWFDEPMRDSQPEARRKAAEVLKETAQKIARG